MCARRRCEWPLARSMPTTTPNVPATSRLRADGRPIEGLYAGSHAAADPLGDIFPPGLAARSAPRLFLASGRGDGRRRCEPRNEGPPLITPTCGLARMLSFRDGKNMRRLLLFLPLVVLPCRETTELRALAGRCLILRPGAHTGGPRSTAATRFGQPERSRISGAARPTCSRCRPNGRASFRVWPGRRRRWARSSSVPTRSTAARPRARSTQGDHPR